MSEQPATAAAPGVPVHAIAQVAHPVDRDRRRALLSHLIKSGDWKQVLVFMRTKHGANRVTEQLTQDGIDADVIHGNRSHGARARAIRRFKEGQLRVLVTTDMAARALNDAALAHVISFDLPTAPEEYLQRIRLAGNTGQAVALVCGEERELLGAIERHLQRDIGRKPVEGFEPGPGYETARYEPNPPQTPQTTSVEGTPGTASSEATPEQKPKHAPQTRQGQSPRKPEGQRGPGRPNHSRTQPPRKEDRRTAAPPERQADSFSDDEDLDLRFDGNRMDYPTHGQSKSGNTERRTNRYGQSRGARAPQVLEGPMTWRGQPLGSANRPLEPHESRLHEYATRPQNAGRPSGKRRPGGMPNGLPRDDD